MNNLFLCLTITLLSGLSTIIGSFIILFKSKNEYKLIKISLLISAIIMAYISIFDLIPESFTYINKLYSFIPTVILIFIYNIFGGLLVYTINKKSKIDNKLYKIGIISMIALILHNIPEGIITFISSYKNIKIGVRLSLSIAIHNIPEGIAISLPIYYGTGSRKKAFYHTLIAALSEPLGGLFSYLLLNKINDYLFGIILSFTAGIMLYLSFFDIKYHKIKKYDKLI